MLKQDDSQKAPDNALHLTISRNTLFLAIFFALGLTFFALLRFAGSATTSAAAGRSSVSTAQPPGDSERTFRGAPGPWGELEYVRINIERPDEFINVNVGPITDNHWLFEGMSEAQVTDLFAAADLTKEQRATLMEKSRWQTVTNGISILPGTDLILGLSPAARQKIYAVLAQSPQNSFQHVPFTFRAGGFEDWFRNSGLAPETMSLVKQLVYQRGPSLCFSDLPEAFNVIPSRDERRRLIKTLSRHTTLLMKLRVRPDSSIDQLVQYWGRAGRAKDIRPLLESLAKAPGGATLDISHLMSPFSRARLYTFPPPSDDPGASHRDCFWTTMNYFNQQPDDRFFVFDNTRKVIESDYGPAPGDPAYGDVVFIYNPRGVVIHAAIYLADDVVFTKNGAHFNQPWILMKMDDLLAEYPTETPMKVAVFRLKNS